MSTDTDKVTTEGSNGNGEKESLLKKRKAELELQPEIYQEETSEEKKAIETPVNASNEASSQTTGFGFSSYARTNPFQAAVAANNLKTPSPFAAAFTSFTVPKAPPNTVAANTNTSIASGSTLRPNFVAPPPIVVPPSPKSPKPNPFSSPSPVHNPFMTIVTSQEELWQTMAKDRLTQEDIAKVKSNAHLMESDGQASSSAGHKRLKTASIFGRGHNNTNDTSSAAVLLESITPTHTIIATTVPQDTTTIPDTTATTVAANTNINTTANNNNYFFATPSSSTFTFKSSFTANSTTNTSVPTTTTATAGSSRIFGTFLTSTATTSDTTATTALQTDNQQQQSAGDSDNDQDNTNNHNNTNTNNDQDNDADQDNNNDPDNDNSDPSATAVYTKVYPMPENVVVRTGEEDEDCLTQLRVKLFRLHLTAKTSSSGIDANSAEWVEVGIGPLKVLKNKSDGTSTSDDQNSNSSSGSSCSSKARIVMRREEKKGGIGTKLLLNSRLDQAMAVAKQSDKILRIICISNVDYSTISTGNGTADSSAAVASESNTTSNHTAASSSAIPLQTFLIKLKNAEECDDLYEIITSLLPNSKST